MSESQAVAESRHQLLVVSLPADLHAAVKRKAAAEDRSMSAVVRHRLREYLAEHDPIEAAS